MEIVGLLLVFPLLVVGALVTAIVAARRARRALAGLHDLRRQFEELRRAGVPDGGVGPVAAAPLPGAPPPVAGRAGVAAAADASDAPAKPRAGLEPPVPGSPVAAMAGAGRPVEPAPTPSWDEYQRLALSRPGPAESEPGSAPSRPGLEERLGARWSVWVGGLALGLGGLFLVRYSIEQGLIGPGARIVLGTLFALALIGAGEWLRRRERTETRFGISAPHIPSTLTAAGTAALFGTVYAAHALYGFIGPTTAFALLGLVGVGTMLASALHGPALAGFGLVGAFASPLLVASSAPRSWPVILYLGIVVASADGLARLRHWRWLALAGLAGTLLWACVLGWLHDLRDLRPEQVHLLLQTAIAVVMLTAGSRQAGPAPVDRVATFVLAGLALSAGASLVLRDEAGFAFAAAEAIALAGAALWRPQVAPAAVLAALVMCGALTAWPEAPDPSSQGGIDVWLSSGVADPAGFGRLVAAAVVGLLVTGAAAVAVTGRMAVVRTAWLLGAGIPAPLGLLALGYARTGFGATSPVCALAAAALAVAFVAVLAWLEARAARDPASRLAREAYAAGAIAALALGLTFELPRGWLTIALALAALGTAFVTTRRDYGSLRGAVGVLAALVLARVARDPTLIGGDVGAWPVVNWLLWGYGVPALAFAGAARLLDRRAPGGRAAALSRGTAIPLAALLVFLELRHALNGGDLFAPHLGHLEAGLQATAGLGFSLALSRLDRRRADPVLRLAGLVFGAASLAFSAVGLVIVANPVTDAVPVQGGALFNGLIPAYLLPAGLAMLLARHARTASRPQALVLAAGGVAVLLLVTYVTLELRRLFHGPDLSLDQGLTGPESWSFSAAWLLLGVMALLYGLWQGAVAPRAASAILILLSVSKVFLFDLGDMEGLWRALSFIALGGALIGIGLLYQRVLPRLGPGPAGPPEEVDRVLP